MTWKSRTIALLSILCVVAFAMPVGRVAYAAADPNTPAAPTPAPTTASTPDASAKIVTPANQPKMEGFLATMVQDIVTIFAWMLGTSAIVLDKVVLYTVVKMGDYVNGLSAVGVVWRIFRDIGNIALIFGFLAIGISIILDSGKFGYNKNMLPMLLIVAATLNFSLFAAEATVDVGNLFATQIYQQIRGGQAAGTADSQGVMGEGISNRVMGQLGLQTMYNSAIANKELYNANSSLIVGFFSIILFLTAATIFFMLALILVFRFVVLILVVMTSPLGIAGLVIPKLGPTAQKWWHHLINQTISAPVLLLMLYVALAVITDVNFLTGFNIKAPDGWLYSFGADPGATAGLILSFAVAMALLAQVAVVAKAMGAAGADLALRGGQMASFGSMARLIGGATNLGGYITRKSLQASGYTGPGSRLAMRGALAAQGARGDIRNIPGVGAGLAATGLGAAAKPVSTGVYVGGTGVREAWSKASKERGKAYEAQMRVPLLLNATSSTEQARLLNAMTDDELKSAEITNYFAANPSKIALLTPNKIGGVDPKLFATSPAVVEEMTNNQFKALKNKAGDFDSETATAIGAKLSSSRSFNSMFRTANGDLQKEFTDAFNLAAAAVSTSSGAAYDPDNPPADMAVH